MITLPRSQPGTAHAPRWDGHQARPRERLDLRQLLAATSIVPAVNQVELHPYFTQPNVQAADAERQILTQAWSPIGVITSYRGKDGARSTFEDETITAIAHEHGKTAAQVMLRWHLQRGRSVIPKSTKPARIAENFADFDFELTDEHLDALDNLNKGVRGGPELAETRTSMQRPRSTRTPEGEQRPWPRILDRSTDSTRAGDLQRRRLDNLEVTGLGMDVMNVVHAHGPPIGRDKAVKLVRYTFDREVGSAEEQRRDATSPYGRPR